MQTTTYKQERRIAMWLSFFLILIGSIILGILSQTGPEGMIILAGLYTTAQVIQLVSMACLGKGLEGDLHRVSSEVSLATKVDFDRYSYYYVPQFKNLKRVVMSVILLSYAIKRHNSMSPIYLCGLDSVNNTGALFVKSKAFNDKPVLFKEITYPFYLSAKLQYGKRPLFEEDEGTERYLTAKVALEEN